VRFHDVCIIKAGARARKQATVALATPALFFQNRNGGELISVIIVNLRESSGCRSHNTLVKNRYKHTLGTLA